MATNYNNQYFVFINLFKISYLIYCPDIILINFSTINAKLIRLLYCYSLKINLSKINDKHIRYKPYLKIKHLTNNNTIIRQRD